MICPCVCHVGVAGLWRAHVCEHCAPNIFKASNNRTTDSTKSVDNRTADPHNRKVIA